MIGSETASPSWSCGVAALTDAGTERPRNEDTCAASLEPDGTGLVLVADGVSGRNGAATASQTAVETALSTYREQPAATGLAKRLYRAVQRANIAVYDLAVVVPELSGMATTLTAVAVRGDELAIMHVGDSRAYLVRAGTIRQLTKDHTVAAGRVRFGLLQKAKARSHPGAAALTRSVGAELIVAVDRIARRVLHDDLLVVCSDGLYGVLDDAEIASIVAGHDAPAACQALLDEANARGTPDNLTAAVVRVMGSGSVAEEPRPLHRLLRSLLRS